jgi:hypothetical protein
MTAVQEQAGQRTLNDPVEVRFTPQGVPLAVRWRGRLWPVAAEPLHWNSGWNRRESGLPAGPGHGHGHGHGHGQPAGLEFWRLQVRATSSSPLRTLEVRKHPGWEGWYLTRVGDE